MIHDPLTHRPVACSVLDVRKNLKVDFYNLQREIIKKPTSTGTSSLQVLLL